MHAADKSWAEELEDCRPMHRRQSEKREGGLRSHGPRGRVKSSLLGRGVNQVRCICVGGVHGNICVFYIVRAKAVITA